MSTRMMLPLFPSPNRISRDALPSITSPITSPCCTLIISLKMGIAFVTTAPSARSSWTRGSSLAIRIANSLSASVNSEAILPLMGISRISSKPISFRWTLAARKRSICGPLIVCICRPSGCLIITSLVTGVPGGMSTSICLPTPTTVSTAKRRCAGIGSNSLTSTLSPSRITWASLTYISPFSIITSAW